ncbi:nucleotidyl transferase AbiEii/AbiGii toxin family protein [Nocardioides cavernaquae]|uniref:Nucleotidyl transferase AbiEii/AbiGii toxin family protein n=1 Tax=Nocardioides cavernaquae TaxID=2321396 RepID=A0A3A5H8D8_9ACTN|nr:nucleotidyl transferase AbiEii/AbiGii toxin family protein [Nocardioides cavernaquae]RJS46702.1 nucleotidyl transferase AbiEii/AbiGii toxin family protein [Nocardioides cavernaquae]
MPDRDPYPTAAAVESAIKDAAKRAAKADPSLDTNKRIQLEYFNRFLSRVFSEAGDSEWVLKGGTGMLARIPSTRATRDIDLTRRGSDLHQALADLIRLATVDLGDHFRFEYLDHERSIGTDNQPYTDGLQVRFAIFIGARNKGTLGVDLAVGTEPTGQVTTSVPANALDLPRLVHYDYRLFPVVDQIADKVCATMTDYTHGPSSREKDLVDLVVFATTQNIDGTALQVAISTEASRRKLQLGDRFVRPQAWGRGYAKLSKTVPYCADHPTVDLAGALVSRLIDPVLTGAANGRAWSAEDLAWR